MLGLCIVILDIRSCLLLRIVLLLLHGGGGNLRDNLWICLRHSGKVRNHASEVELELSRGLNPEAPVNQREELGLKEVEFLEGNSAHSWDEIVPVEDVVVKFGGEKHCCKNEPIKIELLEVDDNEKPLYW